MINITAPGGFIEQKIAQLRFAGVEGEAGGAGDSSMSNEYGVSSEVIEALKKQYNFDKPLLVQYFLWLKQALLFDFGESIIYEESVIKVILERIPISLQFGIISFFLTYLICIILGIRMAVKKGKTFDLSSIVILLVLYSIPPLVLGILMKVFLAGKLGLFPIGDLYSDFYFEKGGWGKFWDRVHHFILPMICYMVGSFTVLSFYVKNNILEEISKDYVKTAKAKGLNEKKILYTHILRNALVPLATGMGSAFLIMFAGSLIIEKMFNINGIGLLSYDALIGRDYPVIMALIYVTSLLSLLARIFSDFLYVVIDPRIDFS